MAQPVKCLPLKPENLEFNPQNPYKGGRRELNLPLCPLSSTHSRWQKCPSLSIIKTLLKLRRVLSLGNLLAKDSSETFALCVGSARPREFPFCRFYQRELAQDKTVSCVVPFFLHWLVGYYLLPKYLLFYSLRSSPGPFTGRLCIQLVDAGVWLRNAWFWMVLLSVECCHWRYRFGFWRLTSSPASKSSGL